RFLSSKVLVEIRVLRKKTDCFPAFHKTTIESKNFRTTPRWRHQSENNFQGRAFPGTIRPEKPVHLAGFNAQVEVLHRDNRLSMKRHWENFGQAVNCDRRISHGECQSRGRPQVSPAYFRFACESGNAVRLA